METSVDCHENVIFDSHRDFWEGGGFSSAKGRLPSSLNRGKASLDLTLPTNQTLFVINLNASRASYQTRPGVFPWGTHRAAATVWKTLCSPHSYRVGHAAGRAVIFCLQVAVSFIFLPAQHLCGCLHCRRELVTQYTW